MPDETPTTDLRSALSLHFTPSKRTVGVLLVVVGIVGFAGILSLDVIGGGREGGIGPTQQAALALMAAIGLFGLTLLPLGKHPV